MSTHLSRKELKQDNVALKVEETTHFLVTHRALMVKTGVICEVCDIEGVPPSTLLAVTSLGPPS